MATKSRVKTYRPVGVRLNNRQADSVRSQIQTGQILKRLHDHVHGKIELEASQVRSAEILLSKSLPSLTSMEMKAEITETPRTAEELIAQGRLHGLTPEQLFGKKRRK
jgi:hypothetical protein